MLNGLYLSAQGAHAQSMQLNVIANNLANADNVGFKRDLAVFQAHRTFDAENPGRHELPPGGENLTGGVTVGATASDFSTGSFKETEQPFDIALAGDGFLRVSDGQREFLTRDGGLAKNAANQLVTRDHGRQVLSTTGQPITVPVEASGVTIDTDGLLTATFTDQPSQIIAQIDVVRPNSLADLEKIGQDAFISPTPVAAAHATTRVLQGHLENSTVEPLKETMEMIKATRSFEQNMNLIRLQDETLARLLQSMAG